MDGRASYRFGRFEVNPGARQVLADGEPVWLGARAFSVLVVLIERRERVVTKKELLELAWPGVIVEEANLQVQISTLRKVLGPRAIATIPGRGYQFVLALDDEAAPARAGASRRAVVLAMILAMSASIALGLWLARNGTFNRAITADRVQDLPVNSIAVLPFLNLGDDADTAYFADGVHEELITQLTLLSGLKVVSRASVMEYRHKSKKAQQIAAELGAAMLLEGSVRRAGSRVRVSAQLIDGHADREIWAKNYDRELTDLFAIQSELAAEIAAALQLTLTAREQLNLVKRPTSHMEAYDLFLRYQDLVHRSTGTIRLWSGLDDRIALLSKAVALDPQFALAWAHLASQHAHAYAVNVDKSAARQARAKEAMTRALALAPDDLLVKIEQAQYSFMALRDDRSAAAIYEEILQRIPHNIAALNGLATVYYRFQGRNTEAAALLERVLTIDPRNMQALMLLAFQHQDFRQFDQTLAYKRRMIEIRPDDLDLQADYQRNDYYRSGSWRSFDRWRSSVPADACMKHARVKHLDIDRAVARRDFEEALRLVDVTPEDARGWTNGAQQASTILARAGLLHASGAHSRAMEAARAGLTRFESALQKTPGDSALWAGKAVLHAMLGQRDLALATHARAVTVASEQRNVFFAMHVQFAYPRILALLGERGPALAELSRQLKAFGLPPHSLPLDTSLSSLWKDAAFVSLVNDPASNAPIPFDVTNTYALIR